MNGKIKCAVPHSAQREVSRDNPFKFHYHIREQHISY